MSAKPFELYLELSLNLYLFADEPTWEAELQSSPNEVSLVAEQALPDKAGDSGYLSFRKNLAFSRTHETLRDDPNFVSKNLKQNLMLSGTF